MKISKIPVYQPYKCNFKYDSQYENYDYDYGTYYNQITIKDAAIFSALISGIMLIGSALLGHEDKIVKFFSQKGNKFNKLV